MLKTSAARGAWPPLAPARWGVRRRRDWSIVVASEPSGVEVAWRSWWRHAADRKVRRTSSEGGVSWRRRRRGSVSDHWGERTSEMHGWRWRRGTHAHRSTATPITSEVWVRPHPSHSSHGPESVHGSILPSTSHVSRWAEHFHHAPPTAHDTAVHASPSEAASGPTTPGFEVCCRVFRLILGNF